MVRYLRKMKLTLLFAFVMAIKSEDVDYGDDVMRLSRLMFRLKLISWQNLNFRFMTGCLAVGKGVSECVELAKQSDNVELEQKCLRLLFNNDFFWSK